MRINLVMEDREYMKALIEAIGRADSNVFINVTTLEECINYEGIVLTDYRPSTVCRVIDPSSKEFVYVVVRRLDNDEDYEGLNTVFKYSNIVTILSELKLLVNEGSVQGKHLETAIDLIAVLSDGNNYRGFEVAERLAKQLIYRTGDRIALIQLNNVITNGSEINGIVHRLIYLLENGKAVPREMLLKEDEFGVSEVRLPAGINPLCSVDYEIVSRIFSLIEDYGYQRIILYIGDAFTETGTRFLERCRSVIWISDNANFALAEKCVNTLPINSGADIRYCSYRNAYEPIDIWIDNYVAARLENAGVL